MYHQTIPTSLCTHINQRHLSVFMGGTSYCLFCSLTDEIHHLLASFFFLPHITIFFKTLFKIIKNHRSYSWMKFVSATQCIVYSRHWNNNIFFFYILLFEIKKCSIVPFPSIFSCTGNLQFNSFISFCKVQLIWCKNYHWGQSHKLL